MNTCGTQVIRAWCRYCAEHLEAAQGERAVILLWASAPTGRAIVHGFIHEGSYGEALNLLEERTRA